MPAAVGALLWFLLHGSGVLFWMLIGLLGVVTALAMLVYFVLAEIVLLGALYSFAQAWTLYFLGGRYPMVGAYLSGEPAVPVWTPPPSFPSDTDEDEDGGPGFPLSPELA